jgi:SOS-response transcriptional repressor LexA
LEIDSGHAQSPALIRINALCFNQVHQMIKTLAARGSIDREPGTARSIRLRLTRAQLPDLE